MLLRTTISSRALAAAAGGAILMGLAATTPARALDDGAENIFSSIASLLTEGVGIGGSRAKPPIEYRERPPLVLPPNMQQLPSPGEGAAARNASWPQDFDVQRHRRALERERRPRENYDDAQRPMQGRGPTGVATAAPARPGECVDNDPLARLCNPEEFWGRMRTGHGQQNTQQVAVGQEPPRRALTDPPAGFRRQTTAQKYTFEVERKVDISDARGQYLEEERRRRAIADGRDPNF